MTSEESDILLRLKLDSAFRRTSATFGFGILLAFGLVACALSWRLNGVLASLPLLLVGAGAAALGFSLFRDPTEIVLHRDALRLRWERRNSEPSIEIPLAAIEAISFGFGSPYQSRSIRLFSAGRWQPRIRLVEKANGFIPRYIVQENRTGETFEVVEKDANYVDAFVRVLIGAAPEAVRTRLAAFRPPVDSAVQRSRGSAS